MGAQGTKPRTERRCVVSGRVQGTSRFMASRDIRTLNKVISIAAQILSLLIRTHEPPSNLRVLHRPRNPKP